MHTDLTILPEKQEAAGSSLKNITDQLIDMIPAPVYTVDTDGSIVSYNKAAVDLWGRIPESGKDKWCGSFNIYNTDGTVMSRDEYPMAIALNEARTVRNHEIIIERPDGTRLNVLPHPDPVFDDQGALKGGINILVDITDISRSKRSSEQKKIAELLDKRVEARTNELQKANQKLERSNAELEQFAYAASHDLQEPLRKIISFSNLILENNGNLLTDASRDHFERMIKASSRMQQLIIDLLSYSRISVVSAFDIKTIDLNAVLDEAKSALRLSMEESKARIITGYLPEVPGIPFQIQQVFQNLIGNAIKFRKPGKSASICITAAKDHHRDMDCVHLKITDEGIGFPMEHSERIFDLFHRLHGKNEYPGTGMGLALCKKIIHNHKGIIYAESRPGNGSTFHILLPETIQAE